MANKYRNEVEVSLNDTKYVLRPSFTCLSEIEDFTNQSLFQLIAGVVAGQLRAKQALFILDSGIKAAGGNVDEAKLKDDMGNAGFNEVVKAVSAFLNAAVVSGDLAKKN
jgi:hypothetical protein